MLSIGEARSTILTEISSDDAQVRAEYLKHFRVDVERFADAMARAFLNWQILNIGTEKDVKRAYVSALTYTAITLHVQSLKVFISGLSVAAGNLMRQVLESIALALLCSGKGLDILDRFMAGKYLTTDAIPDVIHYADRLGLNKSGVDALRDGQKFYHQYSHPTHLTIASVTAFSKEGLRGIYVGAAFDEHKLDAYVKEVKGRLSLAEVFSNFVDGVKANLAKW